MRLFSVLCWRSAGRLGNKLETSTETLRRSRNFKQTRKPSLGMLCLVSACGPFGGLWWMCEVHAVNLAVWSTFYGSAPCHTLLKCNDRCTSMCIRNTKFVLQSLQSKVCFQSASESFYRFVYIGRTCQF